MWLRALRRVLILNLNDEIECSYHNGVVFLEVNCTACCSDAFSNVDCLEELNKQPRNVCLDHKILKLLKDWTWQEQFEQSAAGRAAKAQLVASGYCQTKCKHQQRRTSSQVVNGMRLHFIARPSITLIAMILGIDEEKGPQVFKCDPAGHFQNDPELNEAE